MTRLGLTLLVGVVVGALTLARARHDPDGSFAGTSTAGALAELGGGWSLLAAGIIVAARRRGPVGWLLASAGVVWFAREWSNPAVGSALVFTLGNVLFLAAVPLVTHAALAHPAARLGARVPIVAVTAAYAGAVGALGLMPTLVFDPRRAGCPDCPRNVLLVHADTQLYESFNRWGLRLGLAWVAALAATFVWRLVRPRRVGAAPVLAAAAAYLGAVGWELGHALPAGVLGNDARAVAVWRLQALCLVGVFAGVLWSVGRERRAREEVARLVLELAESQELGGVERVLRAELRDPSLALAYRRADLEVYVDALGAPATATPGPGRVATPLRRGDSDVAVIIHDARLLEQPGYVTEAVAAARLGLANEQLQAEVRAQLAELVASRARIVAAGDRERRRLERDLHDGAQQRLVGLLIALQLLRAELGAGDGAVAEAVAEVRSCVDEALDALREIAHGLYPAVLADEGLRAALEMVAERSAGRVRLGAVAAGRFPPAAETAAYFAAAEASATASQAHVSAELDGGELRVEVDRHESSPLADQTVQEIADRVGAVGGRVFSDGSRLRAEIPCVS